MASDATSFMFHPLSLFIGLRYSRTRKGHGFISFINAFSIVGILLGVAALILVTTVMNGFEGELKRRILGVVPHLMVQPDQRAEQQWPALLPVLAQMPHVRGATPTLSMQAMLQAPRQLQGAMIYGVWPEYEAAHSEVARNLVSGHLSDLRPGEFNIILGRGLASALNVNRGDQVRLISAEGSVYTPLGRMPSQRLFTVAGLFELGADIDKGAALISGVDAARMMRLAPEQAAIRLYLDDPFQAPVVLSQLQQRLGEHYQLQSWHHTQGRLFSAVSTEKNMMWLLLSLIIAVAAFNIVSALVMLVSEKQREIAILRTLGMSPQALRAVFIFQGAFNGVVGALLGLGLGLLAVYNLDLISHWFGLPLVQGPGLTKQVMPTELRGLQIFTIVLTALALSVLAAIYPAHRAAMVQPAKALRYE